MKNLGLIGWELMALLLFHYFWLIVNASHASLSYLIKQATHIYIYLFICMCMQILLCRVLVKTKTRKTQKNSKQKKTPKNTNQNFQKICMISCINLVASLFFMQFNGYFGMACAVYYFLRHRP